MQQKFAERLVWIVRPATWLWVGRIVVLGWLLSLSAPAPFRVVLDVPQSVDVQHPQLCMHTRLIDEVPEYRMQQTLRAIRAMGAPTIVEFFPWAYVESSPGSYDWSQADKIMRHARNQGVQVIARMGMVPEWARPSEPDAPTTFSDLPIESYDDFARYVAEFAARYADVVPAVIVWNEPNLSFEWGYRPVDPVGYTDLLAAVYPVVKARAPSVLVLAGALAPTLEAPGSPNGLDDLLYLRAMYEAGAAPNFDALAAHTYGFTQPPGQPPTADRLNFRRVELHRQIMDEYGDSSKPIYITETGWNDHPRWSNAVSPAERITFTLDAYAFAETNWPWVESVCLWAFRYPRPTYSYFDYFTLVTPDFDLKPIYHALQAYGRGADSAAVQP